MRTIIPTVLVTCLACASAQADFFDDIVNVIENTAKRTTENMVAKATEDMIRGMVIGYESEQTRTEEEVLEDFEKENGTVPRMATVSSYRSSMSPGNSASAGEKVTIKSVIEIVPGTDGKAAKIEERLTIFDNEDNSLVLKTMTKQAGKRSGGEFHSEFSFSLPEGMPQGIYPIRTTVLLNGELARDRNYDLQLVMLAPVHGTGHDEALAALQ